MYVQTAGVHDGSITRISHTDGLNELATAVGTDQVYASSFAVLVILGRRASKKGYPVKNWATNADDSTLVQIVGSNQRLETVYAAQAELVRRADAPAYTNLYQWQTELEAGLRTVDTFDELWRLACEEANETEAFRRIPDLPSSLAAYGDSSLDDGLPF